MKTPWRVSFGASVLNKILSFSGILAAELSVLKREPFPVACKKYFFGSIWFYNYYCGGLQRIILRSDIFVFLYLSH